MKKIMDLKDHAISGGLFETVSRHGDAGAEFLKGLRGIDYETGKIFDRSLIKISGYNLNPNHIEKNINQQAGFSAEVASVSKRNASNIVRKNPTRYIRSEDLPHYGKNNKIVDIVEITGKNESSISQMKFLKVSKIKNEEEFIKNQFNKEKQYINFLYKKYHRQYTLIKRIACGEGGGQNDLSRYLSTKLELPTEQVEDIKKICKIEANKLKNQVQRLRQEGNTELANKLEQQYKNYQSIEKNISDAGLMHEEAIRYRLNPRLETAKDIANVSHQAGIEGAKFGAAIGGGISAITNVIAFYSGNKEFGDAVMDTAADTLVSAGVGYGSAFVGTTVKTYMQQSASTATRALSKTGLPAVIVTVCIATGKSVNRYTKGEIDEAELAQEMGLTATGLLSASMFTMIGQVAIPIPVLGGLIGGMVGYAITNNLYQGFFDALKDAKLSAERRQIIEMKCAAASDLAKQYERHLKAIFSEKVAQLDQESMAMFSLLENHNASAEEICNGMNRFAEMLGKKISINNMAELDAVMLSDDILKI